MYILTIFFYAVKFYRVYSTTIDFWTVITFDTMSEDINNTSNRPAQSGLSAYRSTLLSTLINRRNTIENHRLRYYEMVHRYEMLLEEYENPTSNVIRQHLVEEIESTHIRAYNASIKFYTDLEEFESWEYYWLKDINDLGYLLNLERLQWTLNF